MSGRYKVATVEGNLHPYQGRTGAPMHVSAHVLDRLNAHRVVATFRSEDQREATTAQRRVAAVAAAAALAAEWNEADDCLVRAFA